MMVMMVKVLAFLGLKGKEKYVHSFCYCNKTHRQATPKEKRLKVLEMQGLGTLHGYDIPAERCGGVYDMARDREHMYGCLFQSPSYKDTRIKYWGFHPNGPN